MTEPRQNNVEKPALIILGLHKNQRLDEIGVVT